MSTWPFEDSRDTVCATVKGVVHGGKPVLRVSRGAEDGMFQFLTGEPADVGDLLLVRLEEMLQLDDSLRGVAQLAPGTTATREAPDRPWRS